MQVAAAFAAGEKLESPRIGESRFDFAHEPRAEAAVLMAGMHNKFSDKTRAAAFMRAYRAHNAPVRHALEHGSRFEFFFNVFDCLCQRFDGEVVIKLGLAAVREFLKREDFGGVGDACN